MAKLDALLLPSAVAPSPATPFQSLVDPKIRLAQTVRAINYWVRRAEKLKFKIMVVDNTDFANEIKTGLSEKALNSPYLEIHNVPKLLPRDIARGKGAGETSTLIAGLALLNLPNHAIVAKVNARYITTNGLYLIDELEDDFDFAAWPRPRLDSVDTTFFAGRVGFLSDAFSFVYEKTDDLKEDFVENLYADFSIRNKNCKYIRFNYSPAIKGQSGTTGSKASPLNEFRIVSLVVRARKQLRNTMSIIKPSYQRGLTK